MIAFDPAAPFPLLPLDSYTYKEAQEHSILVDEWLGFRIQATEEKIRTQIKSANPQQNWNHLSAQAFQTPYVEIRNILDLLDLSPGQQILDLGCAYGRMGFVIGAHYPEVRFCGYELENERVSETQRVLSSWPYPNVSIFTADLDVESFIPPPADVYFIFDYGNEKAVRKTIYDLQKIAQTKTITVVARGRLSRFLIHQQHPWLAAVNPPRHFNHFSVYKS